MAIVYTKFSLELDFGSDNQLRIGELYVLYIIMRTKEQQIIAQIGVSTL